MAQTRLENLVKVTVDALGRRRSREQPQEGLVLAAAESQGTGSHSLCCVQSRFLSLLLYCSFSVIDF